METSGLRTNAATHHLAVPPFILLVPAPTPHTSFHLSASSNTFPQMHWVGILFSLQMTGFLGLVSVM